MLHVPGLSSKCDSSVAIARLEMIDEEPADEPWCWIDLVWMWYYCCSQRSGGEESCGQHLRQRGFLPCHPQHGNLNCIILIRPGDSDYLSSLFDVKLIT